MKFPVVDNAPTTSDTERCTFCDQAMPIDDTDIWIMLGAMQGTPVSKSIVTYKDVFAFFLLCSHGGGVLEIVKNGLAGQADIGFCSTTCLRGFFNLAVDALEKKLVD